VADEPHAIKTTASKTHFITQFVSAGYRAVEVLGAPDAFLMYLSYHAR
jgi:hypothetical protein